MESQKNDPRPTRPLLDMINRFRCLWEHLQRTWAFRTWSDLQDLRFVRSSLEFAGLFLLSFVPFLLLLSSALGSNLPRGFTSRANFSAAATYDVTVLFARSGARSAPLSVVTIVLVVISADAIAARLQAWCAAVYEVTPHPVRAVGRRIWWLAGVLGFLAAQVAIGRHLGHVTLVSTTLEILALFVFWWWSLHCLLDKVGWRRLAPGGATIALLYGLVGVGTSLLGSGPITSAAQSYGPIGTVMTLMEVLVALGLAIHLGAYIGARWFPWPGAIRAEGLRPTT